VIVKVRPLLFALSLLLSTLLLPFSVAATAQGTQEVPPPLKNMVDAGFKIQRHFDAGHGLTGWVLAKNANVIHIVYTTADRQVMLIGDLVDEHGANLTEKSTSEFSGHPELEPLFAQLEKSAFIETGEHDHPRRTVYVIFDANCPFCSAAYQSLRASNSAGLRVRWVPVAYLRPDSQGRAAAILESSDPAAALKSNEEGFDKTAHTGGIAPLAHPAPSSVASLEANNALMDKLKVTATPGWIYRDDQGQIQRQVGLPEPMMMLQIMGVPHP
jgi:thiol:disulfide interchange protein DsbG